MAQSPPWGRVLMMLGPSKPERAGCLEPGERAATPPMPCQTAITEERRWSN